MTTFARTTGRSRRRVAPACVLLVGILVAGAGGAEARQAPSGAGAAAAQSPYTLLRSVSGTKGLEENGRFLIQDPRAVFYIPDDRQMLFYFEWQGLPGLHRLEGAWIDPAGKVAGVSAFDYEARDRRFAGRWVLPLSDGFPVGLWTFEARIDGELAGRHPFEVIKGGTPAAVSSPPRRPLTKAETYQRLVAAAVKVDALSESGEVLVSSLGFVPAPNLVVTAFQCVDGASVVRLTFPDGRTESVSELVAWNRWDDWALIRVDNVSPSLSLASRPAWQVGDLVFTLDASHGGTTIVEATIVGRARPERTAGRITISASPHSPGAPLLDEYGEVIGIVGGQTVPGLSSLPRPMTGPSATESLLTQAGSAAVPIELLQVRSSPVGTNFVQLVAQRVFVPLVGRGRIHVAHATTGQGVLKAENWINPADEKAVFSRLAGQFAVVLNAKPQIKIDVMATCAVFDLDAKLVSQAKPVRIKGGPKDIRSLSWGLNAAAFVPGLYRVDILFDDEPVWRTFIRITG